MYLVLPWALGRGQHPIFMDLNIRQSVASFGGYNALPSSLPRVSQPLWIHHNWYGVHATCLIQCLGDRRTYSLANLGSCSISSAFFLLGASCLQGAPVCQALPCSCLWARGLPWSGVASTSLGRGAQVWWSACRPLSSYMAIFSI